MILISSRIFLRANEICNIKIDSDYLEEVTMVAENGHVEAVGLEIKGSNTRHNSHLCLWADTKIPELCPVIMLMIWIKMTGRKNGFLFTSTDLVGEQGTIAMDVDYFLEKCKAVISSTLPRASKNHFGPLSIFKTGYVFGILEKADQFALAIAARHKSVEASMKCFMEANFALELAKSNSLNYAQDAKPYWRNPHVHSLDLARITIEEGNILNKKDSCLYDIAEKFTTICVGVSDIDIRNHGIKLLYDKAIRYQKPAPPSHDFITIIKEMNLDREIEEKVYF